MLNVVILSYEEALYQVEIHRPELIISISDRNTMKHVPRPIHAKKYMCCQFEDSEGGFNSPTKQDCQQITNFISSEFNLIQKDRHHRVPTLLIHCFAGISRSTAASLPAFLMRNNFNIDAAYQELIAARPIACPNRLMVKYMDEIFNLDGRLVSRNEKCHQDYQREYLRRLMQQNPDNFIL